MEQDTSPLITAVARNLLCKLWEISMIMQLKHKIDGLSHAIRKMSLTKFKKRIIID